MANLNKIFLIGNLTRDPQLRYAPSGTAVATFGMATNRNYVTQAGEKKQETCFVNIVVWAKQAELCNQYLTKGSAVFVEGRLQYRSWQGQDGQKRSVLEVRADRVQFLNRAKGPAAPPAEPEAAPDTEMYSPGEPAAKKDAPDPFLPEDDFASQDERDLT
jgi:single-strand DNA-binding protein